MKKLICVSFLLSSLFYISCQKDNHNIGLDDADHFVGTFMGPDRLEVEKLDANSVNLHFIHSGGWTEWNHTFYATVSGKSLTIPAWQNWESEGLKCSGDGFLAGNVLTINYYYSSGFKELGVTYDRIDL
jgi:hypothetical protein